jgi:hypothetical protein
MVSANTLSGSFLMQPSCMLLNFQLFFFFLHEVLLIDDGHVCV